LTRNTVAEPRGLARESKDAPWLMHAGRALAAA